MLPKRYQYPPFWVVAHYSNSRLGVTESRRRPYAPVAPALMPVSQAGPKLLYYAPMKALVYRPSPFRWAVCKALGVVSKRTYAGMFGPLRLVDRPMPPLPGPDWVRLQTILGGVCGTDLGLVALRVHPATFLHVFSRFPAVLGHENVARIDEIGSAVRDWQAGQRVCVEPALGCDGRGAASPCVECAAGRPSLCQNPGSEADRRGEGLRDRAGDGPARRDNPARGEPGDRRTSDDDRQGNSFRDSLPPRALIGLNPMTGGSWAHYFVAHQSQLHRVPDAVTDDAAVLVDPLASAAHAVLRRPPRPGESILVNGAGIIALGVVAAVRALGYDNPITITVRHPFQAELAKHLGATHTLLVPRSATFAERYEAIARLAGGRRLAGKYRNQVVVGGFDLTFECTGTGLGMGDALKWTRTRGTFVSVATSSIIRVDTTAIWFDELSIVGSNGRQIEEVNGRRMHTYDLLFDWLSSGRLDVSCIPVTRYPLADYRQAFAHLFSRGRHPAVKVAFEP